MMILHTSFDVCLNLVETSRMESTTETFHFGDLTIGTLSALKNRKGAVCILRPALPRIRS
jgi:hypothetical protein